MFAIVHQVTGEFAQFRQDGSFLAWTPFKAYANQFRTWSAAEHVWKFASAGPDWPTLSWQEALVERI